MAHSVKCYYCGERFDRDKIKYVRPTVNRYGHASCMLQRAEEDSEFQILEIIDPENEVQCIYCQSVLSKSDETCVQIGENRYAHEACRLLEESREKSDKEKLEEYIQNLFNIDFVEPRMQKQITKYIDEYNYTYSGMKKALQYFYEIKGNDIEKAHRSLGIIPYIYSDAYYYYYSLWEAQQKNLDIQINLYIPEVKEIKIKSPKRIIKKRKLFSFLDEEEDNDFEIEEDNNNYSNEKQEQENIFIFR